MNDTTEIQSGAPAELTRTHNKNLIFAALAEAGIHRVTIGYDGSGDSGQIESTEAWDAGNQKIPLPSSRKIQLASDNPGRPVNHIGLEAVGRGARLGLSLRQSLRLGEQRRRLRHLRLQRSRPDP